MSGDIAPILQRSWKELWQPLARGRHAPQDLFNELLRELSQEPEPPVSPAVPPPEAFNEAGELVAPEHIAARSTYELALNHHALERNAYETAVAGGEARPLFRRLIQLAGQSEATAIAFLEEAYEALEAQADELRAHYRELAQSFIASHNLGYEIVAPFRLHATMPAVFSRLVREVRDKSAASPHTAQMFDEFQEAFFDLRLGRTEARLKTCLMRQFNLLEALGRQCPNVTALTLGDICGQLQWPHTTIRDVGKKLNGFRSDYPGIGHAGNPVAHPLTVKDFVSISMMLASISPYFVDNLDGERCYGG